MLKMRVLIIADEVWNDYVYGNNVLTNWFTGMDIELAEIYASPGLPINNVCDSYFQITDGQMARSIVGGAKAGGRITKAEKPEVLQKAKINAQRQGVYGLMKKLSMTFHTPVLILRDFIWLNGRHNKKALCQFVQEFNPDVVFCPRLITPKLMRLEKIVSTMTKAPFVAFTGDSEVEMTNCKLYTLYGIRRWLTHRRFSKHSILYSHYLMHSADQAKEYHEEFGVDTSSIFKCGDFAESFMPKNVENPIRLVYAGRLYCNRWKSLAEIGKALQVINKDRVVMVLDVYTQDKLTGEQQKALTEGRYIYMKGSVTPKELAQKYREADIALHVESFDEYYRNVTRVSFSTKIIDLLASGCAVMAICWEKHCGYQYLKSNDAAFCCPDYKSILPQLMQIVENPKLINEYQKKAYDCGKQNHSRDVIQKQLLEVFQNSISNNKRMF